MDARFPVNDAGNDRRKCKLGSEVLGKGRVLSKPVLGESGL